MSSVIKYDKLVRDGIIEIIQRAGKEASYRTVSGDEYIQYLTAKLQEEVDEFKEEEEIEELADIIEVVENLALSRGYTMEDLIRIKDKKAECRGGFNKGIVLEEVRG